MRRPSTLDETHATVAVLISALGGATIMTTILSPCATAQPVDQGLPTQLTPPDVPGWADHGNWGAPS